VTHNAWAGLACGTVTGFGLGALLAVLTIRFRVSQVVAGFVLVTLATGLTGYLSEQVMGPNLPRFNSPTVFGTWSIPLLDKIPVIGAGLFAQSPIFYLAVVVVIAVEFVLRRTALGLRVRAVGENPRAAASSGVKARRVRFWATAASGAIGGAGGAYFTIGSAGQFVAGMSSGLGYVALAAVILGSWRATQAAAAALLFGFASSISAVFGLLKVDVPPSILGMAPYVITILVVAGVVAVGRGPAAAGLDID
jgi:simple sugar transport system permease protein